jgi:thioredoxin-like negative regulator of GroEL
MHTCARLVFVLMAWMLAAPSFAVGQSYDQASFDRLIQSGRPTLVMVHADWCQTCPAQGPIVPDLLQTPALSVITSLRGDFDAQAVVARAFKATQQSTLIVFKNGKEVGRSIGDTHRDSIEALLKRAI